MSLDKMLCTLGRFDIPIVQLQPPFVIDLLESNVALFGSAMSGKTTFVKSLVNILHKQYDETQEQVFILDFGGALSEYKELPLVSAYFDNSNEEYVKRVFKIMDNILKDNIKELNGGNFRDTDSSLPHTTFIIDNLNAFIDEPRYFAYQEKLAKLCREGLSKGITIVVTAIETKGVVSYLGGFKQKIAFEMPVDKYGEIFIGKVGMIGNNPGHGFANVTVKPEGVTGTFQMNLPYEVQCVVPYEQEGEGAGEGEVAGGSGSDARQNSRTAFFENLRQKFGYDGKQYTRSVKKYQTFTNEFTRKEYDELRQLAPDIEPASPASVSVGLDYVDFYPVEVDLDKSHVIAIYGKKEFGKTNLLELLIDGFIEQQKEARIVFFDDGRNQLQSIYDRVCGSMESVLINRFEEQELPLFDGENRSTVTRKLSPLQQFYLYLNEYHCEIPKRILADAYGLNWELSSEMRKLPVYQDKPAPFTVFVIQSKLVYLGAAENKYFINTLLPHLVAAAEEKGYLFIFSDVQKISDSEQNSFFNNIISTAFLLDNIAEFAGERGQKTVFGSMDIKSLKEDYARCEKGDGYLYDIEADKLLKLKFIKH